MADQSNFQISRERLEFYYSIVLLIFIPSLLAFNTLWLSNATKRNMDIELRRKANLANEIIGQALRETLPDQAQTQNLIMETTEKSTEIKELMILIPATGKEGYLVLASSDPKLQNEVRRDVQSTLVWTEREPIASLVLATFPGQASQRAWKVITPLLDEQGEPQALMDMSVSLADVDSLTTSTFRQSLIILISTILAILLLLVNHFRLVGYAVLLQKMKALDQLKNDFISVATHELKSPMTIIKGYISMVMQGDSGQINNEVKQNLQLAYEQTDRLNHLVTDLLDVSRLEQGRTKFEFKPVDLKALIQGLVSEYTKKAQDKGLTLEYQSPADLPMVTLDVDRVREIFTNLIDNAIKYTEKGKVTVSHQIEGQELKTVVADSGIGISAAEREKLFQRFYRVRNDKTANISGTGLGLWIIKQYIEKMGGRISLDSIEGSGSQFSVVFPIK